MGKYSQYKVQLASLADGKYEQDFECGTEFFKNMENPDVISSDVHVHLDLVKKNDAYDCTFHCKGTIQVPCDRCLDPLDLDVDTEYHITVKYGDDYKDDSDDLLIIPYSDTTLNVAYMLYDSIVLTIPLRHIHPLGKCNRAMAAALHRHNGSSDDEFDADLDVEDSTEADSED